MRFVVFEILAIVSVLLSCLIHGAPRSRINGGENSLKDSQKWRIEAKSLIFETNSINYDGESKNAADKSFLSLKEPGTSYLKKRQTADHTGDEEWQSQGLYQEAAALQSDREPSKAPTAPYGGAMALILILLVIVVASVIGISIYLIIQVVNDGETVNLADAEVQFESQVTLQADEGEEIYAGDEGVVDEDENASASAADNSLLEQLSATFRSKSEKSQIAATT
uniref:Uncharacterized protein n=1 Tax=Romanomermis culicivorax TaxID=13658 RepID=A0A915HQX7_ROMCU